MNNMLEKTKAHLKKHKTVYLVAGTAVTVAGITMLIMRDHQLDESLDAKTVTDGTSPGVKTVTDGTPGIFFNNSHIDTVNAVVNVLEREGRGHPGYLTRCIEDDLVFSSQQEAAEAYNATSKEMTNHINGRRENINGYHFERLHLAS